MSVRGSVQAGAFERGLLRVLSCRVELGLH
jgi:hypothetical protein